MSIFLHRLQSRCGRPISFQATDSKRECLDSWSCATQLQGLSFIWYWFKPHQSVPHCTAYNISNVGPEPTPSWADVVPHVHRLSRAELRQFPDSTKASDGFSFTTIICQGDRYLPWLERRLQEVCAILNLGTGPGSCLLYGDRSTSNRDM